MQAKEVTKGDIIAQDSSDAKTKIAEYLNSILPEDGHLPSRPNEEQGEVIIQEELSITLKNIVKLLNSLTYIPHCVVVQNGVAHKRQFSCYPNGI